ncbi:hypothetical protein BDF22DRAFT_239454 [Syncephalis plumigaleata]|nr:hypothetical protein BDF22DRAFT_239454 [Syncephalis plumigaleata]
MDPLHRFDFYEEKRIRYFCHLYSFIDGVLLEDYFAEKTAAQAFSIFAEILPEVIKASIYLYNAGIIHGDLLPKNIMVQKDQVGKIASVKIIDLDVASVFKKELFWKPINLYGEEYLLPSPRQKYKSCNGIKKTVIFLLGRFVSLRRGENPFTPNYTLAEQAALSYVERFKQSPRYANLELGDVKAATPSLIYLLKAYHTMQYDNFSCTSSMRASRGLPPRVDAPSSPRTSWFKLKRF